MSQTRTPFIATGLMLFALFFGAGNLIFPAYLGQQAGENLLPALAGFLLTGAGLPLLGVLAIVHSGSRDVQALASRVSPLYGIIFSTLLYLAIGPLFAAPRTATVSFEIALSPFIGDAYRGWALALFSIAFFALAYWFAISPGKLVDRIGKILTPALLLAISILVGYAALNPIGDLQSAQGDYATHPFVNSIIVGYGTMDALASLVFAIIVIDAVRTMGIAEPKRIFRITAQAGILAAACLALVYILIAWMGASSVSGLGLLDNGAAILAQSAQHYFGAPGNALLAVIVLLACLTTAIGLISACAEYFNRLIPRISQRQFALLFTLISGILANKGLAGIISFSVPILMLLYPLTIVLILLAFLDKRFGGSRRVYLCTIAATLIVGILDAWKAAFGFSPAFADTLNRLLLLHNIGMGWLLPAAAGFAAGLLWHLARRNAAPAIPR
ncbi:MAG: branched-chain amino acid transport system II carrier protein [Cardiobacteriaceae bacterium]|nr:branched-chain amino acid transport system II carrier protein [Cardiobacteriaceae bacterium]